MTETQGFKTDKIRRAEDDELEPVEFPFEDNGDDFKCGESCLGCTAMKCWNTNFAACVKRNRN